MIGEWLDHMIDCAKTTALHLAVAGHLVPRLVPTSRTSCLLVPSLFGLQASTSCSSARSWSTSCEPPGPRGTPKASSAVLPVAPAFPGHRAGRAHDALCLVSVADGRPTVFLGLYCVMALGSALVLAAVLDALVQVAALPRSRRTS